MCAPSPPPPPDYAAAATAQGAANADAARIQSRSNNPNVTTPFGQQTVTWEGGTGPTFDQAGYDKALETWRQSQQPTLTGYDQNDLPIYSTPNVGPRPSDKDFYTAGTQSDQPTITQTYAPEQQKIFDTNTQLQQRMGMLGLGAADVAGGTLSNPLDFAGMPETKSVLDHNTVPYPEESENVRKSVIDAMMGRVNEDYGKATDQANSDLIAAGIRPGSKAYGDRMQMIERSRNDARSQAELAAGSEVARQFGMDLSRAQQIQGAQQQGFGQGMDTRRQAIVEALAKRTQPLNEISAFRSGSQISPLQFPGVSPTQFSPAPVFGAAQAQYGAQGDLYNAQAQQAQGMQSGLFSLGAAGIGAMAL
jgi:hypothetical protein